MGYRNTTSVVIPTRNRRGMLARLLQSLEGSQAVLEVIVVDDASDEPVNVSGPRLRVLRNERSLHVAASRNRGAAHARGQFLFFIDDDCVVAPSAVDVLANALASDEKLGIAGPVIAYRSEPDRIWCAGVTFGAWTGRTYHRGHGWHVKEASRLPLDCYCFPSAFAVTTSCFEAVGGFDAEAFPFLMEEPDLAARVASRGYRVRLVPAALVWHEMGPTDSLARRLHIVAGKTERAFLVGRNRGLFIRRHSPSRLATISRMTTWLIILVPVYVVAVLLERDRSLVSRAGLIRSFLAGVREGVLGP